MWIVCGAISIFFCLIAWLMMLNKNTKALWAAGCSLSFVALTLLMEYKLVLDFVNKEDWSALMDVVPGMFTVLCGYVIIMILANSLVIVTASNK